MPAGNPGGRSISGDAMKRAMQGNTVRVHYIGTLDNGRIFDSTEGGDPYSFTIGAGEVFSALESAVVGMAAGEVRNIVISAADAYGPRREENIIRLDRGHFPAGRELRIGEKLSIDFAGGKSRVLMVAEVGETIVTLDGNHPLAGLDLTFALRLEEIV